MKSVFRVSLQPPQIVNSPSNNIFIGIANLTISTAKQISCNCHSHTSHVRIYYISHHTSHTSRCQNDCIEINLKNQLNSNNSIVQQKNSTFVIGSLLFSLLSLVKSCDGRSILN